MNLRIAVLNLNQWAIKWGIPFEAVEDLRKELGIALDNPKAKPGESEAAVQTNIRLEGARINIPMWRNNVGAIQTESGWLRYGLCNDSRQLNKKIKSSDLIGIRPVLIESKHVGSLIGQFVAREVKRGDWKYKATEEEQAQLKFLEIVLKYGGDAAFANSVGTL